MAGLGPPAGTWPVPAPSGPKKLGPGLLAAWYGGGNRNYTLTGSSGSYSYTGSTANLTVQRQLSGAAGSYTYTGQAGTPTAQRKLSGASGSYVYTGQAGTPAVQRKLSGAAGAYNYTGQTASLKKAWSPLSGAAGSYSYAGQAGTLTVQRKLSGTAGAYSYAGQAASPTVQRKLSGAAGSYGYAGQAANLAAQRKLSGIAGAYAYTGGSATLTKQSSGGTAYTLTGASGAYSYTGGAAGLNLVRAVVFVGDPAPIPRRKRQDRAEAGQVGEYQEGAGNGSQASAQALASAYDVAEERSLPVAREVRKAYAANTHAGYRLDMARLAADKALADRLIAAAQEALEAEELADLQDYEARLYAASVGAD